MKKPLIIIVLLCFICSIATAETIHDFDVKAIVCGESSIDLSTAVELNGMTMYKAGDCQVVFKMKGDEIERIYVMGDGVQFLAYSMAAVMTFDPSTDNLSENAGRLFSLFIFARTDPEQYGKILTGETFTVQQYNGAYLFTIGE